MGIVLLGIYLILAGLAGFGIPIPGVILSVLAIVAGILILVGR